MEAKFQTLIQNSLGKLRNEKQVERLSEYIQSLHRAKDISKYTYASQLAMFGKFVDKPFEEVERKDIDAYLTSLKSPSTYNNRVIVLKRFYIWLGKGDLVSDLKPKRVNTNIAPSELLTPEEVEMLASATGSPMYKGLILTLFESAARLNEVLELRIGDVEWHTVTKKDGAMGTVATIYFRRSKGDQDKQPVTISMFALELKVWVESHPYKEDESAYLFIPMTGKNKKIDPTAVRYMLAKVKRLTKIKKRCNPHWLRHSMLSYCANELNYNEQLVMWRAGWTTTSQAKRYIHSGGQMQNSAYLRKLGYIVEEEKEGVVIGAKVCPNCNQLNRHSNKYCDTCGMPLDLEEFKKVLESRRNVDDIRRIDLLSQKVEMLADVVKRLVKEVKPDDDWFEQWSTQEAKEKLDEMTGEAKPQPKSSLRLPDSS